MHFPKLNHLGLLLCYSLIQYAVLTDSVRAQQLPSSSQALPTTQERSQSHLQQTYTSNNPTDPRSRLINQAITQYYQRNNFLPLWTSTSGPTQKAKELFLILTEAWSDGLNPEDYFIKDISQLWNIPFPEYQAKLDLLLSTALVHYMVDTVAGTNPPNLLQNDVYSPQQSLTIDVALLLKQITTTENITDFLNRHKPQHHQYHALKNGLARYRTFAKNGGFPTVPSGPVLKPGMSDQRIPLLIQRLKSEGYLRESYIPDATNLYSPRIVEAVRAFQRKFNLTQDGIIGSDTIIALNTPPSALIQRIRINMERWRWLPHRMVGKQILVNIAGYQLTILNNEKVDLHMPVIVGEIDHKTPLFSDRMRYLVLNPYWNVPVSIAVREILPQQIHNPNYLQEKNMRIFAGWEQDAKEVNPQAIDWKKLGQGIRRYRFRQDPGPENSLGQLKFMFPNKHNIYLHDTPTHNLFQNATRAYSHGCIRVSRPVELAQYLLAGNKRSWSRQQIEDVLKRGQTQVVLLDNPIPIHLLYMTVYADPETDELIFYRDIYAKDLQLTKRFFKNEQ
ncbi:L,D-transpeptidase family protein [Desulfogranum japonicum]|uniref:L,D-transpeptidase family protein n=1 Tax=Desulfogranum japonicum TaxID=231447 RepID=UPI002FC2C0F3